MSQSPSMNDIVFTPYKSQPNFENIMIDTSSSYDIENNVTSSRNNKKRKTPNTNSSTNSNILFPVDNKSEKEILRDKFILENFHYNIKDFRNSISEDSFPKYSKNFHILDALIFVHKIMKFSKNYMFLKYYFINDLEEYIEKIRKRFSLFIKSNNNVALAADMGYTSIRIEKIWSENYGNKHWKDWLSFRNERIIFMFKLFTSKGNEYTTNILDNFYITFGDLNNVTISKNIFIGPKINIGFDANFTVFNMFNSIKNIDSDGDSKIIKIDTNDECFLLDIINEFKLFFQKCNSLISNCIEIVNNMSQQFKYSKLSYEICNLKEIYWEGYDINNNSNKIFLSYDKYLLYECGINDFIYLYDKMFNIIDEIVTRSNESITDLNTLWNIIHQYKIIKQHTITNYNNSQFHIFLYSLRDSKRPEEFIIDFSDYNRFLKSMDCHSLGLFYKISYYSFFLRPHDKIEKDTFIQRMLNDNNLKLPSTESSIELAKDHITKCFGKKSDHGMNSLKILSEDDEEKIQNHLIFKMLVRAANAFVGLPQYDKNEYPKVHSSNSNTNNCEEPILLYNSDSSIDS